MLQVLMFGSQLGDIALINTSSIMSLISNLKAIISHYPASCLPVFFFCPNSFIYKYNSFVASFHLSFHSLFRSVCLYLTKIFLFL